MPLMIQLTHQDLLMAAQAGIYRRISALKRQRQELYGTPTGDLWGVDIEACIAEMLVSLTLDKSWRPFAQSTKDIQADVGLNIQVRHTCRKDGCLILHKYDKDDQIYVLVTGVALDQQIKGWISGADAKHEKFWNTKVPRPAYFVSQSVLKPMEFLLHD